MKPVICQRPVTCIDLTMGSEKKKGSVVTTWNLAMNERLICPAFIIPHLFLRQYFLFCFSPSTIFIDKQTLANVTVSACGLDVTGCLWKNPKKQKKKKSNDWRHSEQLFLFFFSFLGWSTAVSFKRQWEQQSHIKTGLLTLPRVYELSFLQRGAVRRPAAQRNLETLL